MIRLKLMFFRRRRRYPLRSCTYCTVIQLKCRSSYGIGCCRHFGIFDVYFVVLFDAQKCGCGATIREGQCIDVAIVFQGNATSHQMAWKCQNTTPSPLPTLFHTAVFVQCFRSVPFSHTFSMCHFGFSCAPSKPFLLTTIHRAAGKWENSNLSDIYECVIKVRVRHLSVGKHILFKKEAGQVSGLDFVRSIRLKCCQPVINSEWHCLHVHSSVN